MDGIHEKTPGLDELAGLGAAARVVGVHRSTIHWYIRTGRLASWTLADGSRVIRIADAEDIARTVKSGTRGRPRKAAEDN